MSKFINPFTDYGFKLIFGREVSKDLLIEFLNDLLEGERVITDLTFLNNEQLPDYPEGRGIIYDVYCTTDTGEKIIVEMQNRMQSNFKERSIFYLSRAIVNQGRTGHDWKFEIKAVYGVFLMNFIMDKNIKLGQTLFLQTRRLVNSSRRNSGKYSSPSPSSKKAKRNVKRILNVGFIY